ncbi:putative ras-associated and pleckstrin-likey domains-containing protein 1-like [Apostichopus japonicus]|uniref:Putative ras-associated and pleckstrin-likey domains-containing protein 1-like n=1 Tax=Stichopus japonicus TaxID=307972 RepID=A0A2G8JZ88_STIJA|nr:putative ras-associated and pleckstrin-likey domains-containing protein 1-like [Apostichopus japonicus]
MEAEADSDQEQDIDQVLGAWLGELENMTKQMDSDIVDANLPTSPMPQPSYDILDNFRFSQFNLENSQDVDLDALLGDLCEMEQSLQEQIWKGSQPATKTEAVSTVSDSMSPSSLEAAPPPPPPPPPPPGDGQGSAFVDDLPPPLPKRTL